MNFKSDLIYPEIRIKEEDVETAKELLNVYTGRNSIINNILMYLYQASFLDDNLSNILKNIIDVELFHAKSLSKLINLLGFKPRFLYKSIDNYKYYNTSYINYKIDIEDVLTNNINQKQELIENFNNLINKIEDENIKEILKRIVIDEEIHLKIFKELLTS